MARHYPHTLIAALLMAAATAYSHAGVLVGTAFTYQGELRGDGELINGPTDMTFRLFNLPIVGVQIGEDIVLTDVPVVDGRFTVTLDFGDVFNSIAARFLEVEVEGVVLNPRQQITAAPVSLSTRGIFVDSNLDVGIGTTSPQGQLHVETNQDRTVYAVNTAPTGVSLALRGETHSTSGGGVLGHAMATSGLTIGVVGQSNSPDGFGVVGYHFASTGTRAGVLGETNSTSANAVGVHGLINTTSAGSFSAAVRGENLGTGVTGIGVYGSHDGSGWGVYGTCGAGTGVAGYFDNPGGRALVADGLAGIGVTAPIAQLHVRETPLNGLDGNDIANDDLVVEDNDAILGLFSNSGGSFGSGIALREMSGGAVASSWGLIRETNSGGNGLRFTYGANPSAASNPTIMSIDNDRVVDIIGKLIVSGPDTPPPVTDNFSTMLVREQGIDGLPIVQIEMDGDDNIASFIDFNSSPNVTIGSIFTAGDGVVLYGAFTGAHYCLVPNGEMLERGTLVRMTGDVVRFDVENPRSEPAYDVEPTTRANDPACFGTYAGSTESTYLEDGKLVHTVAAVGNGEMWVVDDGRGDIEPGDYLISSDQPGCAMKDDPARFAVGHIVAQAAERVVWSEVPTDETGFRRATISVLFEKFDRHGGRGELDALRAEKDAEIDVLRAENEDLRARLGTLELAVAELLAVQNGDSQ